MSNNYPIVFTLKRMIAGNGFLVGVIAKGRALLVEEDDGFWINGVNPGSVAAGGKDREGAFQAFRDGYVSVLYDIAKDAPTFEAFDAEVKAFFAATNEPTAIEWTEAVARVRAGEINLPIERAEADAPPEIHVSEIKQPTPQENTSLDDTFAEAA
ncbi:MAG: hypothetical protein ABI629_08825 [bacterium]